MEQITTKKRVVSLDRAENLSGGRVSYLYTLECGHKKRSGRVGQKTAGCAACWGFVRYGVPIKPFEDRDHVQETVLRKCLGCGAGEQITTYGGTLRYSNMGPTIRYCADCLNRQFAALRGRT